jgi:hypothetical protein
MQMNDPSQEQSGGEIVLTQGVIASGHPLPGDVAVFDYERGLVWKSEMETNT